MVHIFGTLLNIFVLRICYVNVFSHIEIYEVQNIYF